MTRALHFAVIGSPVAHSRSPRMHAAAYRALGMPHSYEAIETSEAEVEARVEALRRGELAGINVTVPHKTRVLALADEVDPSARTMGAANTLVRLEGGRVRAHNTDAPALAEELTQLAGEGALAGKVALVLGAGGAARAAIAALGSLGVGRVVVRARGMEDAARAASLAREAAAILGSRAEVRVEPLQGGAREAPDLAAIVQATSCGMTGAAPGDIVARAVDWPTVPASAVVLDVVYAPRDTPLLARARGAGLRATDGLGMLARQGALAFALWLGVAPPLDVMLSAAAS